MSALHLVGAARKVRVDRDYVLYLNELSLLDAKTLLATIERRVLVALANYDGAWLGSEGQDGSPYSCLSRSRPPRVHSTAQVIRQSPPYRCITISVTGNQIKMRASKLCCTQVTTLQLSSIENHQTPIPKTD